MVGDPGMFDEFFIGDTPWYPPKRERVDDFAIRRFDTFPKPTYPRYPEIKMPPKDFRNLDKELAEREKFLVRMIEEYTTELETVRAARKGIAQK